jgi:teichuronic acid biosynthesis glycosyltransferase TuaH
MRDVVFTFWHETWTDSMQRLFMTPDRLLQTLLVHEDVGKLLIADPFRMGATQFARRLLGRRPVPIPPRPHATGVVSPLRFRRRDGVGEATLRASYVEYDRRVSARARDLGLEDAALITTNPFYAAYAPLKWTRAVTYYAFDDWAAFDDHSEWWPDYAHAYETIRARGHRVCAVSQHLLRRLDPIGPGIVVPNGITPSEWQQPWRAPDWLATLPRPQILYSGAIHGRLDVGAVAEVAKRFPGGSVIIIGPVADPEVVRQLRLIPRVHIKPALSERDLIAGLTRSVDVCIMPHHRTPLTESMSPLKIYEYCAAGRPVAATDIAPVRGIHDHVVLVGDGQSFADGVERALAIGPIAEAERQTFLAENSWASRHDVILDLALAD